MELVTPSIGLAVWTAIAFLILLFLLGKFAWPIILDTLKEREQTIEDALKSAEASRRKMEQIKAENAKLLKEANEERDQIIKEAREAKDKLIADAKTRAQAEADAIVANAREAIKNEKNAAIVSLKNQVATISLEIAEKVIRQQLSTDAKSKELVDTLVKEIKLN